MVLVWTCELAKKYHLPEIVNRVLEQFRTSLTLYCTNPGLDAEWCWSLTIYLFEMDDLTEIRAVLLAVFQGHGRKLAGKESFLRKKLLKCPGLAIELALKGGLDGKGFVV